ncbi:trk system potassium uptake protein TrkA [Mycoplasma testudineum]|uniref:Trk system potassium uptake protein TrkA n=1 Tax=Mycoplasma testudineum TaxID=244584 RepID=A0A4R6IFK6_9MOLU|nr:TrkA family potassium uptake protein [Mycoplasma testudineum]OYD26964.1 potassium transporter KtrA [Mycoplasma testudineum]TDO20511.1 trk system potassium uptake protein TrkA [Mycoplasma testudineum]
MFKYKNDIAIIGMGRFGSAVANQLIKMNKSVVIIDSDEELLRPWADQVNSVYAADASDLNALQKIGITDIKTVIVAAPNNIEIVATLLELKVNNIIARSTNVKHARVLKQIGVDRIVLPEMESGTRTALIAGNDNFIKFSENMNEIGDGFVISSTNLYNSKIEGKKLKDLNLTKRGVSIILIKQNNVSKIPTGDTVLGHGDLITMIGKIELINDIIIVFNRQRKESNIIKAAKDAMQNAEDIDLN